MNESITRVDGRIQLSDEGPPSSDCSMRASDLPLLTSAEFCNGCKVAKATHEHCSHSRKQHGADLEAGKAIHTANPREYGDDAQKHTENAANPTNPQQKDCHA